MKLKDYANLKEMLIDFNEYSTDYTKTRCKELEKTIENTLEEIERLNNIIKELDKQNVELGIELSITKDNISKAIFFIQNQELHKNKDTTGRITIKERELIDILGSDKE